MSRFSLVLALSLAACSKSDTPPASQPASKPASKSDTPPASQPASQPLSPPASPSTPVAKPAKDPEAAKKMIAAGAIVVDVRTADEFAEDHLPQATNIPIEDFARRLTEVDKLTGGDKTKPLVVHCASGNRSAKAKQQLEAAGYTQVVNGGGLDDLR